jgi:hypothetical protein
MNNKLAFQKTNEKRAFVKNAMSKLGITEVEANALWSFDKEEVTVPEVEAIEAKLAAPKTAEEKRVSSPIAKVKNMKAQKKADAEKEAVLQGVFDFIKIAGFAVKPQQVATTKVVFQGADGGWYTVAVTKNKDKPDGYTVE